MQSLRAYLELFYKIAVPKKGRNTSHFLENLYGGVLFLNYMVNFFSKHFERTVTLKILR